MATPTFVSIPGKGWDLQLSISSSYTSIPGVKSFTGPGSKVGTRDVTGLLSSAGEVAPTIFRGGKLSAEVFYDSTNAVHAQLQTLQLTQPSSGNLFKAVAPTTTKFFGFNAVITGFGFKGFDVEGSVMYDLEMEVNGPITYPTT